ncbi:hypothetical protein E2320_013730, partial [Naja naja]
SGAELSVGYSAQDLKGLTVEHTIDSFQEGQTVILTLKDKGGNRIGVLEEAGGDVLVNVNMVDREKAKKNTTFKKTKRRVKKIRKKEKPVKAEDLLPFGIESSEQDFGTRGRGKRRVPVKEEEEEEEEEEEGSLVTSRNGAGERLIQSDDIRVEKMEISSEDGEDG